MDQESTSMSHGLSDLCSWVQCDIINLVTEREDDGESKSKYTLVGHASRVSHVTIHMYAIT